MLKSNAILTFKIAKAASAVTRDPVTGAPIQQVETVVVEASMEAVRDPGKATALAGVDESALYLEGRLVSPKFLTDAMKVHKVIDMVLDRGRNTKLKGKLYLLPFSSSRLKLEGFWGDFLSGYFQVGG